MTTNNKGGAPEGNRNAAKGDTNRVTLAVRVTPEAKAAIKDIAAALEISQGELIDQLLTERRKDQTMKLYYCSAGGHLWYYGDNGTPLFYKTIGDATDEEVETAEEKYCGCND